MFRRWLTDISTLNFSLRLARSVHKPFHTKYKFKGAF